MDNGLMPCPFCGGEAFVNDDPTGNGGKPHMSGNVGLGRLWSVECDECGADAGFWQDRDVAIAAWNTRAYGEATTKGITEEMLAAAGYAKERTCHHGEVNYTDWFVCSECGHQTLGDQYGEMPRYCSNCGAKVVE